MPPKKGYTPEFKEQAVRLVLEEIEPDESRKHACDRLAPRLSIKAVTLHNWVKQSAPSKPRPKMAPGSIEELRAQNAALRKENRLLARANAILSDAAAFFGAALDRQRGSSVRSRAPASRGRADLQSAAGRPVGGPLGDVTPGVRPPPSRRGSQAVAGRGVQRQLPGL
jgi:transposase